MKDINIEREEQFTKLLNVKVEDIESITVLQKDAAIAKWGDKGSNGVIVINTRSGQPGCATDSIYNTVAEEAQFPGGEEECVKFIAQNIRYPKLCQEFGVQGRVIIKFVVEKDGSITEIKKVRGPRSILSKDDVKLYKKLDKKGYADIKEQIVVGQDIGELLYEEAERVVKLMPNWKPAKDRDGNIVRCYFNLPIMFRLR